MKALLPRLEASKRGGHEADVARRCLRPGRRLKDEPQMPGEDRSYTDMELTFFDFFLIMLTTCPNRSASGLKAVLNSDRRKWEKKTFTDEIHGHLEKPYRELPSERLEPKTNKYMDVQYAVCTCGIGLPHDENNNFCLVNLWDKLYDFSKSVHSIILDLKHKSNMHKHAPKCCTV
jgi:hypothetical protein